MPSARVVKPTRSVNTAVMSCPRPTELELARVGEDLVDHRRRHVVLEGALHETLLAVDHGDLPDALAGQEGGQPDQRRQHRELPPSADEQGRGRSDRQQHQPERRHGALQRGHLQAAIADAASRPRAHHQATHSDTGRRNRWRSRVSTIEAWISTPGIGARPLPRNGNEGVIDLLLGAGKIEPDERHLVPEEASSSYVDGSRAW